MTISIERFARITAPVRTPGSGHLSSHHLLGLRRFLREHRATLAASFDAARAYEQAGTVAARRDAIDRFLRS